MKHLLIIMVFLLSLPLYGEKKKDIHMDVDLGFVPQLGRQKNSEGQVRNTFKNSSLDFSMGLSMSFVSFKSSNKNRIKCLKTGMTFISPKRFAITITPISVPLDDHLYLNPMFGIGGSGVEPFVIFALSYEIF